MNEGMNKEMKPAKAPSLPKKHFWKYRMHQTEYIFARQGDSEQGAEVECTGESLSGKNIEKWEKPAECCKVSRVIGDKDRSLKQVPCHPAIPPARLSGAGHSYFQPGPRFALLGQSQIGPLHVW